jgi:hypothetical protein
MVEGISVSNFDGSSDSLINLCQTLLNLQKNATEGFIAMLYFKVDTFNPSKAEK